MTEYVVSVRLKADGSGLVGEVKLSAEALKDLAAQTGKADSQAGKLTEAQKRLKEAQEAATAATQRGSSAWIDYMKGLAGYDVLLSGAKAAFAYAKETMMLAARHEELAVVMAVVGRNAGYTRAQMGGYAQEVRAMGITMIESRNTVVQLAQAEIDLSHASLLARAAQDAAVIGMTNSSDALQRMIYGIKSGQTDVLRTLGINVNFEASYKRLAAELHKTTEALSEKEKMQARETAVLEETAKLTGVYEEAMGSASKQMRSMARYTEDLKVIRGEVFNEALTVAVMAFVDQLKEANKEVTELSQSGKLKDWGSDVATTLAWVADMAISAAGAFRLLGVTIGEYAALTSLGIFTSPDKIKAIQDAAEADRAAIISSMSMFRDALDARRATLKADADKRLAIDREYVRISLEIHKAGLAGASDYTVRLAALTLRRQMYPEEFVTKPEGRPGPTTTSNQISEYARLTQSIREKIAVSQLELQTEGKLTEGQKLAMKVMVDLRDGKLKATAAQKVYLAGLLEQLITNEKLATQEERDKKLREEALAISAKLTKEARDRVEGIEREASSIEQQAAAYGLAKDAVIELDIARLEERALFLSQADGYETEIAAINRLIEAKRRLAGSVRIEESRRASDELRRSEIEGWRTVFSTIESTGKNVWSIMTAGGEGMAKSVGRAIKASISDLLYQLTARKWMIQIGAGIEGSLYGTGGMSAAGQSAAGSWLGSGASSALQWGGSAIAGSATAYGAVVPGLSIGGTQAAMLAAQTGEFGVAGLAATASAGSGATAAGGAAAAAGTTAGITAAQVIPVVGIVLAALYFSGAFDSDDEGPRNPIVQLNRSTDPRQGIALGAEEFADRGALPAQVVAINDWLAQLPDRLQEAMGDTVMAFAPGTSFDQAWSAAQQQIIATAQSLNLTAEELRHLASIADQTAYAAQTAAGMQELNLRLLEATGRGVEALGIRRKAELDAMDATLRPIQEQINAAQDLATASAAAAEASAAAAEAQAELARAHQYSLDAVRSSLLDAYNRESDALTETRDRMLSFVATMKTMRDSLLLGDLSPLSPEAKYAESRRQLEALSARARLGDAAAQEQLAGGIESFLQTSRGYNASNSQYGADFAWAMGISEQAQGVAERHAGIAQAQLGVMQQQVTLLGLINQGVTSYAQALNNLAVAYGVPGVSAGAIGGVRSPVSASGSNTGIGDTGYRLQGDTLYFPGGGSQRVDGANAAAALIATYGLVAAPDGSYMRTRAEGGYTPPGLTLVGEQGPELVRFSSPSRVYTAAETRAALAGGGGGEMAALLKEVLAELRAANTQRGAVGAETVTRLELVEQHVERTAKSLSRAIAA